MGFSSVQYVTAVGHVTKIGHLGITQVSTIQGVGQLGDLVRASLTQINSLQSVGRVTHYCTSNLGIQKNSLRATGERVSIFTAHSNYVFTKDSAVKINKDWVVDMLVDFSEFQMADLIAYEIKSDGGIRLIASRREDEQSVMLRVAFGLRDRKRLLRCVAESETGEKRSITLSVDWV